ncbi:Ankyrin repeat-containing protein [Spironucleus salmonicida]|uniref:Ankyrin repeat-containing protein n=1 Tax=Spironucleus salmonicida TaxID=348837 RepID=V6LM81_9EUKA|nr:Ankyrin repeat-containing protein [Spironucleus salmonicida]|eukprot:EST45797.1 Ankyrin repeat-containing protein [Spironucleus salmonicida]
MDNQLWFDAAESGDLGFIENNIIQFKGSRNQHRDTALMIAVSSLQNHLLPILIQAEYGLKNSHGQTALLIAVLSQNLDAVMELAPLESGSLTTTGKTALVVAFSKGFPEIVRILFPWEASYSYNGQLPERVAEDKTQEQFSICLQIARNYRAENLWPFVDVLSKRVNQLEYELYGIREMITDKKFGRSISQSPKLMAQPKIQDETVNISAELNKLRVKIITIEASIQQIKNNPKPVYTIGDRITTLEAQQDQTSEIVGNISQNINEFHSAMKIVQKVIQDMSEEVLKLK